MNKFNDELGNAIERILKFSETGYYDEKEWISEEKLKAKLAEHEEGLKEAKMCHCACHIEGSMIRHFMPCCYWAHRTVASLESEILELREKLCFISVIP